jgi:hypothetical protein
MTIGTEARSSVAPAMSLDEFAAVTGMAAEQLREWVSLGLLDPAGTGRFDELDLPRLMAIERYAALGCSGPDRQLGTWRTIPLATKEASQAASILRPPVSLCPTSQRHGRTCRISPICRELVPFRCRP